VGHRNVHGSQDGSDVTGGYPMHAVIMTGSSSVVVAIVIAMILLLGLALRMMLGSTKAQARCTTC